VSKTKFPLTRSSAACLLVCVSMFAHAALPASASASSFPNAANPVRASQTASMDAPDHPAARSFRSDNPVAIRDTLAKQSLHAASPTLRERISRLIALGRRPAPHDGNLATVGLERELVFVVPVPYGVLYQSNKHELTIDADLSGDDRPGAILLAKTIQGPSGRGLVIAPEASEKGYIQHIDLIELKANGHNKTTIHGHFPVSQDAFARTHGEFEVALRCTLVPPYLKDQHEHSDPTDEEPTDITTRTSTLYATINAIWLISPRSDTVLTRKLRLSN
jgi:hypothetical protein